VEVVRRAGQKQGVVVGPNKEKAEEVKGTVADAVGRGHKEGSSKGALIKVLLGMDPQPRKIKLQAMTTDAAIKHMVRDSNHVADRACVFRKADCE
jgi:hypothetical protein